MQLRTMSQNTSKSQNIEVDKSKPLSVRNSDAKVNLIKRKLDVTPSLDNSEAQLNNIENERFSPNTMLRIRQTERQINERYMFEKQYFLEKIKLNKLMEMEQNILPTDNPEEDISKLSKQYERLKSRIYSLLKN